MVSTAKKSKIPIGILIYCVCLYIIWTCYHFFVLPQIEKIPNELASSLLDDGLCKNLIWTLPAVLLIRKYSDELKIKFDEFFLWKKEYWKYALFLPAFFVYVMAGVLVNKIPISFSLSIKDAITVLFVGVTEEFVFRGLFLNYTAKKIKNEDVAIAINAMMFLAIHFPRWIQEGIFVNNIVHLGFLSIIILSVIFSVIFLKTKNIVIPIILHMFWDMLIFGLY